MKKVLLSAAIIASTMFVSTASYAACDQWGPVTYLAKSGSVVLAIVNNSACFVNAVNANDNKITDVMSVLADALANGKNAVVSANGNVAIQ